MVSIPPPITQMKTEFERARRWRRSRREPLQLGDTRWEALDRFLSLGFPTAGDEEWRLTDVTPIAEKIFTLALASARDAKYLGLAPLPLPDDSATELVFVNGYCLRESGTFPSLPPGARVESLSQILDSSASDVIAHLGRVAPFERRPFVALNTALFVDGACILIPPHTVLEKPIHVRFISTGEADMRPAMSHPRVLVLLGDASRASVVESYVGPTGIQYLTNAVTEIVLGENAGLEHYKIQCESTEAYHTSATNVSAARGANCSRHNISLGGALVRDEVVAVLGGENAKCMLNGLYLANGQHLVDNHTTISHVMRWGRSRQVYNGILADHARSVFASKIMIGADAHQSDAKQMNRVLLLSNDARINSTAHLENSAKQAQCIQRTASRRIDEDAFYIRSRSLAEAEARRLAMLAFVRNGLKRLTCQPLAIAVEELLSREQLDHW